MTQSFIDLTASDDEATVPDVSPSKVLQSWGARTHRDDERVSGNGARADATLTGWQPRKHPDPRQRPSLVGASSSSSASSAPNTIQEIATARNPAPDATSNPKAISRTGANGITVVSEKEWRNWPGGPSGVGRLLDFSAWKNHPTHAPSARDSSSDTISSQKQPTVSVGSVKGPSHLASSSGNKIDRHRDPRLSGAHAAASNGASQSARTAIGRPSPANDAAAVSQEEPKHSTPPGLRVPGGELAKFDVPQGPHSRESTISPPPPVKRLHDGSFKRLDANDISASRPKANEAFSTYLPTNWDPSLPKDIQNLLKAMRRYTHNGKPNRKTVMKWAEKSIPDERFFIGHGDLSTKSPLSNYTLAQLGMTEEAWKFLNRKGGKQNTLPGTGKAKRVGRPPVSHAKQSHDPMGTSDRGNIAASTRSSSSDSIRSITFPAHKPPPSIRIPVESSAPQQHVTPPRVDGALLPALTQQAPPANTTVPETADARAIELQRKLTAAVGGRNMFGAEWLKEEDDLLIHLKETLYLRWQEIWLYFKYRCKQWQGCQVHYSGKFGGKRKQQAGDKQKPRSSLPTRARSQSSSPPSAEPNTSMTDPEGPRKSSRLVGAQPRNYRPRDYFNTVFSNVGQADSEDEGVVQSDGTVLEPVRVVRRGVFGAPIAGDTSFGASSVDQRASITHSNMPHSRTLRERDRDQAALAAGLTQIPREPIETSIGHGASPRDTMRHVTRSRLQTRRSIGVDPPYLAAAQRDWVEKSDFWQVEELPLWQGSTLHVDFSEKEAEILVGHVLEASKYELQTNKFAHLPHTERVAIFLVQSCEETQPDTAAIKAQIALVSRYAINQGDILNRTKASVEAFLVDATAALKKKTASNERGDLVTWTPKVHTLQAVKAQTSVHKDLRGRELGSARKRNSRTTNVREAVYDSIGPLLSFTGTSSDVNAVAWSPNGDLFGIGSAAWVDPHSMQYNRPNNLLIGSVGERNLKELPYHAVKRERADEGSNATHAMHTSQDPLLYQSVSAVGFTSDGSAMISAGYDQCVRVVDLRNGFDDAYMKCAFKHSADIDVLALNSYGLFATGSKSATKSIRVFRSDLDTDDPNTLRVAALFSPRAKEHPDQRITPSALKWGHSIYSQSKYLLCGFSSLNKDFGEGEVCAWDLEAQSPLINARGSRNIFDVAWSPCTFGRYAVGRTPQPGQVNRGTQSVVHLFDSRLQDNTMQTNGMRTIELECPALDMNDIVFNPTDDFLLSVGCTDGATYVWDIRHPDQLMHRFAHGKALMELPDDQKREESDTGVRFVSWDATGRGLCTASSDGIVAKWSPYRAPDDAFEKNIVQLKSGVMSGAFNHDFSCLLLGEVNGSINVLSVGRNDEDDTFDDFSLQRADEATLNGVCTLLHMDRPTVEDESGTTAARDLLQTGEMKLRPFGDLPIRQAVQGPAYQGPFDTATDANELRGHAMKTQASFKPSADPCPLEHEIPRITEEEKGDDGSSRYRIPGSFAHLPRKDKPAHLEKYVRCFRCGSELKLRGLDVPSQEADMIDCKACKLRWRIDLLGYTPSNPDGKERGLSRPATLEWPYPQAHSKAREQREANRRRTRVLDSAQADFTKEEGERNRVQALDEYVHSFWQDRSPSP